MGRKPSVTALVESLVDCPGRCARLSDWFNGGLRHWFCRRSSIDAHVWQICVDLPARCGQGRPLFPTMGSSHRVLFAPVASGAHLHFSACWYHQNALWQILCLYVPWLAALVSAPGFSRLSTGQELCENQRSAAL